jgi:hypothetical protein
MPALLHDPELFHAKLDSLRNSGGKAQNAAERAWSIILELAGRKDFPQWLRNKLTAKGEARIDKAGKFDLGDGYRLIFVRKHGYFIFLFLGTHDECDTWISNHHGINPAPDECELVPAPDEEPSDSCCDLEIKEARRLQNEQEKPLHEVYDQETLREIFPGICGYREDRDPS